MPHRSSWPTTSATRSGLDTISMGVTLAFVAEASRGAGSSRGRLGVPFGWGDSRGMLKPGRDDGAPGGLRRSPGRGRVAAGRVGAPGGDEALLYAVKGLELPAHSARALKGISIGYATATRGGSHHDTRPTPQYAPAFDRRSTKDKPAFAMKSQHFTAVGDSLVMCRFTSERGFGLFLGEPYAAMVGAVTGWDVTVDELERMGERIINLERLFNVREGVRAAATMSCPGGSCTSRFRTGRRRACTARPRNSRRCSTSTTLYVAGMPTACLRGAPGRPRSRRRAGCPRLERSGRAVRAARATPLASRIDPSSGSRRR